jgi:TetR/AcrR family transcriptional repressor for divergent bdcA
MQTDRAHPLGCLVVLSAANCAAENRQIQAALAEERAANRAGFERCVRRAIAAGELPTSTDVIGLATLFDTFLVGISTAARDGVSLASLQASITQLMRLWDESGGRKKTPRRGRAAAGPIS